MFRTILWVIVSFLWTAPLFAQSVDTAWVRRYNGPGNAEDWARDMTVDSAGNVYVTGEITTSPSDYDYATIKYYPNGDTAWFRTYNATNSADVAYALAVDASGNVYVTGRSQGGSPTYGDYATIKYDADGNELWVKRYDGGFGDDMAYAVTVDDSGNVYVSGASPASGSGYDLTTIKYRADGDTAWIRRYNGPASDNDEACAIVVDDAGNVYVTGSSYSISYPDFVTLKYDSSGTELWVRRYSGPGGWDQVNDMAIDDSSNIYVTGGSCRQAYPNYRYDYATIKYFSNGDTAWVRKYPESGNSSGAAYAIAVDGSGNVYITGGHDNMEGADNDFVTIKYYANGDTAWVRRYNAPEDYYDDAYAITVDSSGNIYVTGRSHGGIVSTYDYATIKYDPSGNEIWIQRYNGPGDSYDEAYAIATDRSGNVFVTGKSCGEGVSWPDCYDYATIKYWQNYAPEVFSLLSPEDSALIPCTCAVDFDWADAIDSDPWDTVAYCLYISTSPIFHPDSTVIYDSLISSSYTENFDIARFHWKVKAFDKYMEVWSSQTYSFLYAVRGDVDTDCETSTSDIVYLVNYIFRRGPEPDPELMVGDVNCDGLVNIVDLVYLINYVLKSGPPPCEQAKIL